MIERKYLFLIYIFFSAVFSACGGSGATDADDVSSSNSTANGTNLAANADYSVEAYESLPVCNDRKEGQTGYVKGTSKYYVCEDGEWVVTNKPSSPSTSTDEDDSSHDDGDVGKGKSSSSRSNSIPDFFGKSSESSGISVGGYDPSTGILTDSRDGQKYKTIKIGDQVWMAENLNYAYLQPTAELDSSSFCYDNDPANCKEYGRLYLWSAAMDSAGVLKNDGKGKYCGYFVRCEAEGSIQGICPNGWHLPSKDEFETLLGSVGSSGEERSANLRDPSWEDGVDEYGFSALPAGHYSSKYKEFDNLGGRARFWSSTEGNESYAYYLVIHDDYAVVGNLDKYNGISVRCLKD